VSAGPHGTGDAAIRGVTGRPTRDAVEVMLEGELDLSTFDDAQRRVQEAERGAPELLVLDLSALGFVDSTGVRLVLLADERARAGGRRLAVRLGTGPALRVFEALGLLDKIDVLPPPGPAGGSADGGGTR
jgi:anti-anti-sigma factor